MSTPLTKTDFIAHICEQIALGVYPSAQTWPDQTIPAQWWSDPGIENLLRIARVQQSFAQNHQPAVIQAAMPTQIGQWRVLRLLGHGGMGEVYLGERTDAAQHRVAIKCVRTASPRFAHRLEQELRILAKLNHANVARFIDAGTDASGMPWLALEYVDGVTITRWCQQNALGVRERLQLFLKVCAAVAHAHRHLIVHRDIKPDNILVDPQGEPKLLDFGISKLLDTEPRETTVNSLTTSYAAPEQLEQGEISTATDTYALGLLLFEMLSGSLPVTRLHQNWAGVLSQLHQEEHQRPSQNVQALVALPYPGKALEGDLDAIVSKAIRYRPELRYGSVPEFAADIERYLHAQPVLARAPSLRYRLVRLIQRNKFASAFFLSAVLALCTGSGVAFWQAREALKQRNAALSAAETSQRVSSFAFSILRELNPQGRNAGVPKTASEIVRGSIERARKELVQDAPARAMLLSKLGEIQSIIDSPDAAESAVQEALAIRLQAEDSEPKELAIARQALATIRVQQGRWEEAEALTLQTVPVFAADPSSDRYHAMAYSTLALIARNTARTELAVERLARAHALALQVYGADAPNTIEMQGNRAMLLVELGRNAQAKTLLLETIAAFERTQGKNFPRLIGPLGVLAQIQLRTGEFQTALKTLARADQIGLSQLGVENHQYVRHALASARVYLQLHKIAEAEQLLAALKPEQFQARTALAFDYAVLATRSALMREQRQSATENLQQAEKRLTPLLPDASDSAKANATFQLALLRNELALSTGNLAAAAEAMKITGVQVQTQDKELQLAHWALQIDLQLALKNPQLASESLQAAMALVAIDPPRFALWHAVLQLKSARIALINVPADKSRAQQHLSQAKAELSALQLQTGWQKEIAALERAVLE